MGSHLYIIGNPYNGYINPYYWVDDHPLLYGNNGSLDPSTGSGLVGLVGLVAGWVDVGWMYITGQMKSRPKTRVWGPQMVVNCKGIPLISGKSRLVKYYSLARYIYCLYR